MTCGTLSLLSLAIGVLFVTDSSAAEDARNEKPSSMEPDELADSKTKCARLRQSCQVTREDYELLLETLLKSKDEDTIMLGLRHMHKCQSYGFHPYSMPIHNELIKLTYSENKEIREAAVWSVMRVAPTHAADHGYQAAGAPWRPVSEGANERMRDMLDEEIAVKGTYTLQQLESELRKFGMNVRFHPDVEQKPLDVDARGVTLRAALTQILEPRELNYWIEGENILIAPPSFPRSRPVHVYNVRGILSDGITLSRVVELAKDVVSEDNQPAVIERVGEHKMSVKGSEFQHHRIAIYLGTIAPELKGEL